MMDRIRGLATVLTTHTVLALDVPLISFYVWVLYFCNFKRLILNGASSRFPRGYDNQWLRESRHSLLGGGNSDNHATFWHDL